jgi:amino acid transporter
MGASDVFIRKASGLVRVISPTDALMYAFLAPTIPYAYHYILWAQALYPGADIYIASLFILTLYPIAALYIYMSVAMPRSGGEYVYTSRIIHPYVGLLASWGMVLGGGLCWSGSLASWGTMWGLGAGTVVQGLMTRDQALVDLGILLGDPTTLLAWVHGALLIFFAFFIMWLGTKWVMRVSWVISAVTWIMLASFIYISLTSSPAMVAGRMAKLQGLDYTAILKQAEGVGWVPGVVAGPLGLATVGAGLTYISLSTLGSTYVANIAGEIKEVRKAQILAQLGSLALFIVYWVVFTYATYSGLGRNLIQAISYLNANGLDKAAFGNLSFMPAVYFLTVYLTDNPILAQIAGPAGFYIINFGGIMALGFAPIRNLFAYSFDGILPSFVSAVDKKGHAWGSVLLGCILALIIHTVNTFTPWLAMIAFTIAVWFISWTIFGIAGMIFPWRRRDIFEKSPALVKRTIGGVPVVSILGLLTTIISASSTWLIVYPALTGAAAALQAQYLLATIAFLFGVPTVLFWVSYAYNKMKGIPVELRFKEVPPD